MIVYIFSLYLKRNLLFMNIALVAHDSRKKELIGWVTYNMNELKNHNLYATGTTGKLIKDYKHILFMIGETCVDESKRHITSEEAIEKIRSILTTSKSLSQNNQDLGRTQERME